MHSEAARSPTIIASPRGRRRGLRHLPLIGLALALAAAASPGATASHPGLVNAGFEAGDARGWTLVVPPGAAAGVVTSHAADSTTYVPAAGTHFLLLKTDGPGSRTTAAQAVALDAGETLEGWAALDAHDHLPFDDDARVQVLDAGGAVVAQPFLADVAAVGSHGDQPWTRWSFEAPAAGVYTLRFSVSNALDGMLDSHAVFDMEEAVEVAVDVMPGSDDNPVNPKSRGVVPVAILSLEGFDAASVDPSSVCFGDPGAPAERDCGEAHATGHLEDADADGDLDLVLHFETAETGLEAGDGTACLTGRTHTGVSVQGCDRVRVL